MANEGKRWERNFKKSIPGIIRLYDTTSGYSGVKNPCDFVYYLYPFQYLFECKSVEGTKLYFSAITENQHEQLDYYDHIYGVTSLIAVEFREIKKCYLIPYKVIKRLNESGEKSIDYITADKLEDVYEIPAVYKRTNCRINLEEFQNLLGKVSKSL